MDFWLGIGVIVATVFGPVLAVAVTMLVDWKRDRKARRTDVFRSLMGSRRAPLSFDRVKALNMVEIEFYGISSVLNAHRELMQHINTPSPVPPNWQERQRSLMTRLLSEMAKVLRYDLQQLDVLEGGYYPQGYADIETEQQQVRRLLIALLGGNQSLRVSPAAPTPPPPFPPPPIPDTRGNNALGGETR